MFKLILIVFGFALVCLLPSTPAFAQGPTRTPDALSGFLGTNQVTQTPSPANPVRQTLEQDKYIFITSGNWYDLTGKPVTDSVYVMMLGASTDPKSDASVRQIAAGFAALRANYPNAANYHVLLLNGPYVHDASTTSRTLQLLNTQLITADAFIRDVLNGIRTVDLVKGSSAGITTTVTPVTGIGSATRTPTRAPTRVPTQSAARCDAPPDKARLYVKNGYSGIMRLSVGAPDVGFQKDFDIPADGQYHYIDLPPSSKYTYSASIPGVGKASDRLPPYAAGQCYDLTFQP